MEKKKKKKKKKKKNFSFLFFSSNPGEMLAIIGGSGAGKSTLLDILARRKTMGEVVGGVMYNGAPIRDLRNLLLRVSGYVTQEDILKETLTVRETLMFQAELRLDPRLFSTEAKVERVNKVMADLGISHRADAKIGNEAMRGLSGGEKKRVAIASQLVTDPSVLFLDEPTSGLDSYNSLAVVRLLRSLAEKGKTVICTVHQPRSTMFDLFDRLLVLNQGRTVYHGPAQEAASYFGRLGFKIPEHVSPADYVLDVLLDPERAQFAVADVSKLDFADSWDKSAEAKRVIELVSASKQDFALLNGVAEIRPYATSFFKQLGHLLVRQSRITWRDPASSIVGLAQALIMAFVLGSVFYQLGFINPASSQGRAGILFFIMINDAFSLSQTGISWVEERLLVNRERASGTYGDLAYFLAKVLVETPIHILQTGLFVTIMYWMAQLNQGAVQFFLFYAINISTSLAAVSLYSVIGIMSPNTTVASILIAMFMVLFFQFSGFLINSDRIPVWWIWLKHWSFFSYTYPALMVNEFLGEKFSCVNSTATCATTGEEVLANFSIPADASIVWQWIVVLLGMTVGYRLLAFIAFTFFQKEKR